MVCFINSREPLIYVRNRIYLVRIRSSPHASGRCSGCASFPFDLTIDLDGNLTAYIRPIHGTSMGTSDSILGERPHRHREWSERPRTVPRREQQRRVHGNRAFDSQSLAHQDRNRPRRIGEGDGTSRDCRAVRERWCCARVVRNRRRVCVYGPRLRDAVRSILD